MSDNSGIHIGGSNTGNVNTGNRVTQTIRVSGDPEAVRTVQRIDQLLAVLLADAGQLPADAAEVVTEEAGWLREQLQQGQLPARHVRHALAELAAAAAPVASIMTAVGEVTDLVLKLLH